MIYDKGKYDTTHDTIVVNGHSDHGEDGDGDGDGDGGDDDDDDGDGLKSMYEHCSCSIACIQT